MNKKTAAEILQIIKNYYSESNFAYNEWLEPENDEVDSFTFKGKDWDEKEREWLNHIGLGEVVEVKQYGGEGQGETWYSIKHFVDHDVFIRIDGFYTSYNGTDFYDGYGTEVRPASKTVTVYE